jgi:hypothetical protein
MVLAVYSRTVRIKRPLSANAKRRIALDWPHLTIATDRKQEADAPSRATDATSRPSGAAMGQTRAPAGHPEKAASRAASTGSSLSASRAKNWRRKIRAGIFI